MNYFKLEEKIGYKFKNAYLLEEALTHSSYAHELIQKNIASKSNERLEFLGDAVLEIIASTYLFEALPDTPEGELTRIRSEIICTDALSSYAMELSLGDYLLLGNGERRHGGKNKLSTLENAFEALLGAIYLDSGKSIDTVKTFLVPFLAAKTSVANRDTTDFKSELQHLFLVSRFLCCTRAFPLFFFDCKTHRHSDSHSAV